MFANGQAFFRRYQAQTSYAIAAILGILAFHLLYNAPIFMQLFWGMDAHNDLSQHVTGYYAFRSSPWSFPVLWTDQINSPSGLNIYFTDSIPIFALPFKVLAPLLPPNFHYFKLWLFLVYLLQPVSAVYLIRVAGQRSLWAAFFAAAFSLLLKWLLFRFNHEALSGQFLLIISLAFYLKQRTGAFSAWRWQILILAAFLVHSYLTLMILGIYVAAVFDHSDPRPGWISGLLRRFNLLLLPILMLVCAYAVLIGKDDLLGLPRTEGFGYFSLNLLGPFYGGNLIKLPAAWGPTAGQVFEDQSYLGLGVTGLILAGAWAGRRRLLPELWRERTLLLVMLCFWVFSLSSDVFLGLERVYHYPDWLFNLIVASPLGQFRATARFFWPIGYFFLFWSLAAVLKKHWAIPVLACLLLVQVVDIPKPFWPRPAGYTQAFNPDFQAWEQLFSGKRALYLYPTYSCGGDQDLIGLPAVLVAVRNGLRSNTASATRFVDDCPTKVAQGLADLSAGTVHLFTRPADYSQVLAAHPDWCAQRKELAVCIPNPSPQDRGFLAHLSSLSLPKRPAFYFP